MSIHVPEDGSNLHRKKSKKKRSRSKDDSPSVKSNVQLQDYVENSVEHHSSEHRSVSNTDKKHIQSPTDVQQNANQKRNKMCSETSCGAANSEDGAASKVDLHQISNKKSVGSADSDHCAQSPIEQRSESGSDVPGVLLSRMAELLSGVPVEPYTETLAKFDWEKVRFASFSAEDCKRMWSTISRQIRRYRTLAELVQQAQCSKKLKIKKIRDPDKPKLPSSAFFHYFMEKRQSYSNRHTGLSLPQVMKALSKKYRKLPAEKQQKYIDGYIADKKRFDEEMAVYSAAHPVLSPLHKPVTVAQFYAQRKIHKKEAKAAGKVSRRKLKRKYRQEWDAMPTDRKKKIIAEALAAEEEYQRRLRSGEPLDVKCRHVVLSRFERAIKNDADGRIKRPPNGYSLFCKKYFRKHTTIRPSDRFKVVGAAWRQLPLAKKKRYLEKGAKKKAEHMKYVQSLPADEREKLRNRQKHTEKFEGEPVKPPKSAYLVFSREAMQKSKSSVYNCNTDRIRECGQSWSKLSAEEKQHYKDVLDGEWQQYLTDVDEFKKGLSEEQLAKYEALNKSPVKTKNNKHVVSSQPAEYEALNKSPVKTKNNKHVVSSQPAAAEAVNGIQTSSDEPQEKQQRRKKRKLDSEHNESATGDNGMIPDSSPSQHKKKKHKHKR